MSVVNKYKLKDGVTAEDIIREVKAKKMTVGQYGRYIHPDVKFSAYKEIVENISVCIGFPEDLSKWDDFNYVLVMDEDFGQPYTPFYNVEEENKRFAFVMNVVGHYNKLMDSLSFLERVT